MLTLCVTKQPAEQWKMLHDDSWIVGLPICMRNISDHVVTLTDYSLLCENPGDYVLERWSRPKPEDWRLTGREYRDVQDSIARFKLSHGQELLQGEIQISPGEYKVMWCVDVLPIPRPEMGRPHFAFQAKDNLGNTYELDIPARPARVYRS